MTRAPGAETAAPEDATPSLELRGIVKRFGGVAAVDHVSLAIAPGEVVALVGENGAGKSTLIQVACGLYRPDAGEVRAAGRTLPPGDPRASIAAGLGVVYQHFMLLGPLPVWENVILGREPRLPGLRGALGVVDRARARREVREAAERFGLQLDVDAEVRALGVGAQQRVEIVKQLWRGARVLILDEPTAVLSPVEADELIRTARALASEGRSVLFISHKLREVLAVADRIAVLRRGKLVLTTRASDTGAAALAEAVMGKAGWLPATGGVPAAGVTPRPVDPATPPPAVPAPATPPRLIVRDLRCPSDRGGPALRGVSFALRAGEVLGLAGVDGNGQGELAEVVTGLRPAQGTLVLDGEDGLGRGGWARSAAAARARGVVHLPEDRQRRALCGPLSLEENLALGHEAQPPWARGPGGLLIDRDGRRARSLELLRAFDVRPPDPRARASALSGGNQQKLVAARELRGGGVPPRLVVAVQPTRGLDPGAARRVHDALLAARDAGAAVLVASLDLDELRALASRILVIADGRAIGELPPTASDHALGRLMLGQRDAEGARG
ncbi:MAG: ABC transporter ATP-binding protein [Myxococcales bacterium]